MSSANLAIAVGFAPGFIGYTISLSLYGMMLAQSIIYLRSFPDDNRILKYLVISLCAMDTLHVWLVGDMFWNVLIYGRLPDHPGSSNMPWQLLASFIIESFVTAVVQCFFCVRVWRVSKNLTLSSIIGIASAMQFGTGNAFTIKNMDKGGTAATLYKNILPRLQMISSMVCDIVISASLVYYFRCLRVGMARTQPVLQQLMIFSVNVGVLLSIVTGVSMVLFEVKPGTYFSLAPQFILSKLYLNSFTATLNARKHFREVVDRSIDYSISVDL
ncbi:hypothetical protein PILCRDRAFT_819417 [Piloderma croceum F 1598]|uniref:DUF6534 domain-containing protein n=1 Tax=Piloderma croceum (strain F 1598) TaxID=765440 RepID=A0A0C3BA95_PILCF|nr:hypothetical protein PILCRDRAFT_819417 [Piloderma croceum F 1598]